MLKNKIIITEERLCRSCFHKIDAHTAIEDTQKLPMMDDLSICAYCGTWSKFDEHGNLLPLTPVDIEDIIKNDHIAYKQLVKGSEIIKKRINEQ